MSVHFFLGRLSIEARSADRQNRGPEGPELTRGVRGHAPRICFLKMERNGAILLCFASILSHRRGASEARAPKAWAPEVCTPDARGAEAEWGLKLWAFEAWGPEAGNPDAEGPESWALKLEGCTYGALKLGPLKLGGPEAGGRSLDP